MMLAFMVAMIMPAQPCPLSEARVFGMCQEPHNEEDIRRLAELGCDVIVRGISCAWHASPQQARERMASKEKLLALSRELGITFCTMITGSALYPEIVPEGKLEQWASRDAKGQIIPTASWHQGCLNNPEFRAFIRDIGRAVIDAGADGIHYDESYSRWFWMRPIPCFCDHCCAALREWLGQRFSADELHERWGITDLANFNYRQYLAEHGWADEPLRSPLHPQWWLMQLHSTARWERWIVEDNKAYAREHYNRQLVTNANQYMMATLSAAVAMESTIYDFVNIGTGLGVSYRDQAGHHHLSISPAEASLIPTYLMARAATPDKPVVVFLDIQDHPQRLAALREHDEGLYMQWLLAEAYLSGCYFAAHYRFSNYEAPIQPQAEATRFFREHSGWYRGSKPLAEVGVLYSFPSQIWDMYGLHWAGSVDYPVHSTAYYGACEALLRANVQWDTVFVPDGSLFPGRLTAEALMPYRVVIAPSMYCANDAEIAALAEYMRRGGKVIIAGPFAEYDAAFDKRTAKLPAELSRAIRIADSLEPAMDPARADLEASLVQAIVDEAGLTPRVMVADPAANLLVRVRRPAEGRALLVDIINRDFSWDRGFRPSPSTKLFLRLADQFAAARGKLYTFDRPAAESIAVNRRNGVTCVELPEVECYALLVLE